MNIDKNNWFIREDSLTEEQYMEVCKYLVENYEAGEYPSKIEMHLNGNRYFTLPWEFIGVVVGRYTTEDTNDCKNHVITYQQFLEHIKVVVGTANSTPDTPSENPWIGWKGGECPVGREVEVEIELRDGSIRSGRAGAWRWTAYDITIDSDIVKYRILPDDDSTPDTNVPTLCENPSQSLTDTLEWMFELGVEHVEADSERMTITHKRIGEIVMDVTVDFKDIKSMLEGLKDN